MPTSLRISWVKNVLNFNPGKGFRLNSFLNIFRKRAKAPLRREPPPTVAAVCL